MFTNFPLDVAGNLDYKNLCYVITHGEDKEQEWNRQYTFSTHVTIGFTIKVFFNSILPFNCIASVLVFLLMASLNKNILWQSKNNCCVFVKHDPAYCPPVFVLPIMSLWCNQSLVSTFHSFRLANKPLHIFVHVHIDSDRLVSKNRYFFYL